MQGCVCVAVKLRRISGVYQQQMKTNYMYLEKFIQCAVSWEYEKHGFDVTMLLAESWFVHSYI